MGSSSSDKADAATKSSQTAKTISKMHRRSRSGCFTCRLRRKKCDEGKPKCKACRHLGLECEYKRPLWWSNNETRRNQKDYIKSIIRRTKTTEKTTAAPSTYQGAYRRISAPNMPYSVPTPDTSDGHPASLRGASLASQHARASMSDSDDEDYEQPFDSSFASTPGFYDAYSGPMYTAQMSHPPQAYSHGSPYEVDVKTERQMFINDVPTRRDSTISTFSTFLPPTAMLPSYPADEWAHTQPDYFTSTMKQEDWSTEEGLDVNFFDFSHGVPPQQPFQPAEQSSTVTIADEDRLLFDYMLSNVLRLLFPVLEANQHGSVRNDVVLPALENNAAYLHSCLNAAAIHQRATLGPSASPDTVAQVEASIMRHKFAFVSEVVAALNTDTTHTAMLEATLAMIALHTVVGRSAALTSCNPGPENPDAEIPWHAHFQAATELVSKLSLPFQLESMISTPSLHPPFNMTLTAWIDILGSTMLGRSPIFANTYRTKHIAGSTSGLAELMGCHDSVMYLLSEVSCLDSLKCDHKLDDVAICSHITSLAQQLDHTETPDQVVKSPYSSTGALRPKQLSRNITAIFRKATRVYLCSLVPTYSRYDSAVVNLISQMSDMLQYVPAGPAGFDRSLVWPYLICGANCTPTSPFRRVLAERIELLGDEADHGSFGRMVRLLHQVWQRNDEIALSAGICEPTPVTAVSPNGSVTTPIVGADT
ncbi:hypothetical protein DV736_g3684, partial [Chaetothyriales sp. CBS 134916]